MRLLCEGRRASQQRRKHMVKVCERRWLRYLKGIVIGVLVDGYKARRELQALNELVNLEVARELIDEIHLSERDGSERHAVWRGKLGPHHWVHDTIHSISGRRRSGPGHSARRGRRGQRGGASESGRERRVER